MSHRSPLGRLARLIALGATLVLVGGVTAPAHALPAPIGEYVTVAPTVLRTVAGADCQDAFQLRVDVDLQGLGNELAAQGYYTRDGDPVYTALMWDYSDRITGPDNYYSTGSNTYNKFPTSSETYAVSLCGSKFSSGQVQPGVYTVTSTIVASNDLYNLASICHPVDGCLKYPKIYERTITQQVTLTAPPPQVNQPCIDATAKVKALKAKIKKIKAKKMAPKKKRAKVATLKRKLRAAKGTKNSVC